MKTYHLPSPQSDYIALARSRKGRLFKKQILKFGNFAHPNLSGEQLVITPDVGQSLIDNFQRKVCDIVQFPIVGDDNAHTEDPLRNAGEIVDLSKDDFGIWATIDVRDAKVAPLVGNTILGASAMLHMDYRDTRTGQRVGPTLLHVAATNRPYITDLEDFEELIAMSADGGDNEVIALTEVGDNSMLTLDEIKQALLDHGIDLDDLMAKAGETPAEEGDPPGEVPAPGAPPPTNNFPRETVAAMSNVLEAAGVTLSNSDSSDGPTVKDLGEGIISLAAANADLTERVESAETERDTLRSDQVSAEVDGLISEARILPFQRDDMIHLASTDRERFDRIVPPSSLVSLSEQGVTSHVQPESIATRDEAVAEIDRLAELAKQ